MIHEDVWQDIQILAIREGKNISELVEEIFRERLARAYQQQKEQFQIQPQPQSQHQQLQPQQSTSKQQHNEDEHEYGFRINVPGLRFPIGKKDLMNLSKADFKIADFGILHHIAKGLPDKFYEDKEELEKDLVKAFNDDARNSGLTKRITECNIINDEKSRMDAAQFLEEQRTKKKIVSQRTEGKRE